MEQHTLQHYLEEALGGLSLLNCEMYMQSLGVVCQNRQQQKMGIYHRERNCYRPAKIVGEIFSATVAVTVTEKYSKLIIFRYRYR
eukprot:4214642-Amphidinium_carterae.1